MKHRARRGSAAVAAVIVMAILGLIVVAVVAGGARDQDLTVKRLQTVRAFYAAEAGMNMAIRELAGGVDEDGDGSVGGISDDGDDTNDPMFGSATVSVSAAEGAGELTLTSRGRAGDARRTIEAQLE